MAKIITPEFCDLFRKDFNELVKTLEKKHGVKIKLGSMKYDPGIEIKATLTITEPESDKRIFDSYCHLFDLEKSDYGSIVKHKGTDYKLIGLEVNRSKFPIKLKNIKTGDVILITEEGIKHKLNKNKK